MFHKGGIFICFLHFYILSTYNYTWRIVQCSANICWINEWVLEELYRSKKCFISLQFLKVIILVSPMGWRQWSNILSPFRQQYEDLSWHFPRFLSKDTMKKTKKQSCYYWPESDSRACLENLLRCKKLVIHRFHNKF